MAAYVTVPETLRQFYSAEYLYNMLPLDVVGDTLGTLYGRRRSLKSIRQLYREPDAVWRQMFRGSIEPAMALGVRDLIYQRVAVSRTRNKEPITLAPAGLDCIGEGQGDRPVANAYRAVGGLCARFFTAAASEKLLEHIERWSEQPLARLTQAVLDYADTRVGGKATKIEAPRVAGAGSSSDSVVFATARQDLECLIDSWDAAAFGPEQQLDQLRVLVCFHVALHILRTAAQPLAHRGESTATRLAFVCDAAQVVGSPMARVASQSLAFWMGRVREANLEICYRSAASLHAADPGAWDRVFDEIESASPAQRDDFVTRRAASLADWVFPEDKRRRSRNNDELTAILADEIGDLYAGSHPPNREEQQRVLADAMLAVFGSRSRVLHKVFECVRSVGDGAGFIGPKGTHQKKRFMLRADLLETLSVLHCSHVRKRLIEGDDPLSVGTMLETWFGRYGIVVDAARPEVVEAIERGRLDTRLVSHLPDAALSSDNVRELEDRLVELRLARRFSDASVTLDERALLARAQDLE